MFILGIGYQIKNTLDVPKRKRYILFSYTRYMSIVGILWYFEGVLKRKLELNPRITQVTENM